MQKTSEEKAKDQWNTFFDYMMGMQDTFAESLPDELPTLPGFPALGVSPKEIAKQMNELQKMAKDHAVEQTESAVEFSRKGQKKVREMVKKVKESVKEEKAEAEDEAPAEK